MANISYEEILSIQRKANIVDIIRDYVPLTQRGKNYFGICPFHDDHNPSMSVSPEKGVYKCFVCGNAGNVFNFVMEYEKVSFYESVKIVADKIGVSIDISTSKKENTKKSPLYDIYNISYKFYQNNLNTVYGKDAKKYLLNRKIDEDVMKDVVSICIKNLMKLYEIDFNEKDNEETIELLAQRIKDLRELKIYLNSVISFNHVLNNNLNIQDTMLLELIKSQNVELYEEIWRNRQYFISEDTTIFGKSYNYGIREFNIKAKKYFASLFDSQTNEEYKEILAFMFPYVENYLNDREVRTENAQYFNGKEDYQTNLKNKRIFNARYFELYFSQSNNEFTTINKIVEEFVKTINNEKNIEIIKDTFGEVINLYTNWIQKFTFETLQLYLNEIKPKYLLLKIINKHLKEYDDTAIFFGLSALRRICIIMAELITEISKEEFDEFTKNMENDYLKIWTIKEIVYWIENGKNNFKEGNKYRKDRLNSISTTMAENVFTNNIDILNKNCYFPNNLNAIFEIVKGDNKKRKEYIKNILDQENVFRFLNEILGRSIGSFRIWICYKKINNRRIFKYRRN